MTVIQIFGVKSSSASRSAERFFKERGAKIQIIDLKQKPLAPGELRRFVERFGLSSLLDVEGKSYLDSGLQYLKVSDADLIQKIEKDPKLLRLPLVRGGNRVAIGQDEAGWKAMLEKREGQ